MRLNSRNATSVRQKIQASQLINRLQKFVDGEVELNGPQVKAACYLISQSIGNPPQEVTTEVNLTANVAVRALVARLGDVSKARDALQALQAPGLIALLPSNTIEAEIVDSEPQEALAG